MHEVCEAANQLITNMMAEQPSGLRSLLLHCESPVEQMLTVALYDTLRGRAHPDSKQLWAPLEDYPDYAGIFTVVVELQKTIDIVSAQYRVDFLVHLTRYYLGHERPKWGHLVVEVDGHDFHDRTKEQAPSDRKRDRTLLFEGMNVMRFTGIRSVQRIVLVRSTNYRSNWRGGS